MPLTVLERAVYRGPNIHSHRAMIRIQLDLAELEAWPTDQLPDFNNRLLAAVPSLDGHGCSYQEAGGFVRRLREGTWLGHVVEHLALELQTLAGAKTTRGKTRSVRGRPGVYNVMYVYEDEAAGLMAGRTALELVDSLLPVELQGVKGLARLAPVGEPDEAFDLQARIALLSRMMRAAALGPSTRALADEARRRGIPVRRMDDQSLIQLGWGSRQKRIRASVTGSTSLIGAELAGDKAAAKQVLGELGLPVPRGVVVRRAADLETALRGLKAPVVIKPLDGNHGRGVTLGVTTLAEAVTAFEAAAKHSRRVVVEEQLVGVDHRVLVVGGKVVAVAERRPAQVVGDGASTISQLIDQTNADPKRGDGHANVMTRITVDAAVESLLAARGYTVESVPAAGEVVVLRDTANLSTGGTAIDRTDVIHPDNAAIARRAALAIGLDVAGIDFLVPDITRSVRETGGGIVEVNAAPGLRMHVAPSEGTARDVAKPIIESLFPRGSRARIPILAVTGTNGKSTVGRMLAEICSAYGTVGLTGTAGIYIGDERVAALDASGPKSARLILNDPSVDIAVLECARGGILREGLAFDRCDVGAVLNVAPDHLGKGGIETVEDLADVKAVVVEAVRPGGVSVLNADDPLTLRMARHAGGKVAWFSMRGGLDTPPMIQKHLVEGGLAALWRPAANGGVLSLHEGETIVMEMQAGEIPATLGGHAAFNIQNALAAMLMTHAVGIDARDIRLGLARFASTFEQNPGRLNVRDVAGFRVIVDYAHNAAGLRALGDLVKSMRDPHGRAIGMVSIPGDRRDDDIREIGAAAGEIFDLSVFRETPDGRGRPPGVIARLMTEGAVAAGTEASRLRTVLDEDAAADECLREARPGDLVVLLPTTVERIWNKVCAFRPEAGADPALTGEGLHG